MVEKPLVWSVLMEPPKRKAQIANRKPWLNEVDVVFTCLNKPP